MSRLGDILDAMTLPLHVETITGTGTVPANSNARISGSIVPVSGYTPIGIIGLASTAGASATITEMQVFGDGTPTCVIRNISSSALNLTVTFKVLYAKAEALKA